MSEEQDENDSTKNHFTWIPFYEEFAQKLLLYKNNRQELTQLVYGLNPDHINYLKGNLENTNGSDTPEIDPFSIFGIFNRGIKDTNRTAITAYFKKVLGVSSDIPTDFHGIPVFNNKHSFFINSKEPSFPKDIEVLWLMFEAALCNDETNLRDAFDEAVKRNGWGIAMLTMALFWIAPNTFLPLVSKNKDFLEKNNFSIPDRITFESYKKLLNKVRTEMQKAGTAFNSFPEFSYLAYLDEDAERNYWSGGIKWNEKDKKSEFINGNFWQIGWDKGDESKGAKQAWKNIKKVKVGDYLAFHSYGGTNDLTIHYLSEIISVLPDEGKLSIKKLPDNNYYKGKGPKMESSTWFGTLVPVTGNQAISTIFHVNSNTTGENTINSAEILSYIDFLKKHRNIIFHGAPGTGKTYLAQQIAKQMEAETEFVQFHLSYDYTDFVEGLRPVNNADKTNMIFERKDGSFKAFCKKAVRNLQDSKKSIHEMLQEVSFKDKFFELLDKIRNEELKELQQRTNIPLDILQVTDNDNIMVKTKNSEIERTYTVSYGRLEKLSKVFVDKQSLDNIKNIDKEFRAVIGGSHSSAYWAALHWIYTNQNSSSISEISEPIKQKDFIFIIDEINRGEISKIFGELFFSVDPGYRGEKGQVKTQYQNLIETGDIFEDGFYVPENVYIIATMNDIDRSVESMDFAMRRRFAFKEITAAQSAENFKLSENTKKRMESLNNAISNIDGLNSAYHIGAAYFKQLDDGNESPDALWEHSLHDLLVEYLKGSGNEESNLKLLKNAFDMINIE